MGGACLSLPQRTSYVDRLPKAVVVEEQLEAATHTIIQDMKPSFEKLIVLFENEVKTLVEVSHCKLALNTCNSLAHLVF